MTRMKGYGETRWCYRCKDWAWWWFTGYTSTQHCRCSGQPHTPKERKHEART